MKRQALLATMVAAAFIAVAVGGCAHTTVANPNTAQLKTGNPPPAPPAIGPMVILRVPGPLRPQPSRPDLKLFWEIWDLVKTRHVNAPISDEQLMYGAIQGMIRSAGDKHSRYVTPERWKEIQKLDHGSYSGIGATMSFEPGELTVEGVFKGGPADKAGIRPGDRIEAVNGQPTKPLGLVKSVKLILGPKGTKVVLTVRRAGLAEPLTMTIVRDRIKITTLETKLLVENGHRLAYIRLSQFTLGAVAEFEAAVLKALAWKAEGVILDLRGNPGGYVRTVRRIGGAWIGFRTLFLVKFPHGRTMRIPAMPSPAINQKFRRMPTVLLIDKGSASASEILAGALKDYRRATLIGVKSYGKGSVQTLHPLSNGGRLALTEEHWLTPTGQLIHHKGIEPDIEVKQETKPTNGLGFKGQTKSRDSAKKAVTPDSQLDRATKFLLTKIELQNRLRQSPQFKRIRRILDKALRPGQPARRHRPRHRPHQSH